MRPDKTLVFEKRRLKRLRYAQKKQLEEKIRAEALVTVLRYCAMLAREKGI